MYRSAAFRGQPGGEPIYVCLGSNLGDRESNLRRAAELMKSVGLEVTRMSSVFETEPVGLKDQPWYLNQVVQCAAPPSFRPHELLSALLGVEREMGRERTTPGGPRVIDIDLLLWGDLVINPGSMTPDLTLPHPRMHLRRFVLEPMCELAAAATHPVLNRTCAELLDQIADESVVRVFKKTVG
ncbi:MAG TPA: 2-amino-4-hydroxy-6-hydroxymethyldihydropteridine diphosphokinase [Blastocatellia bacterium]|nr:2-amino-4-hydroxy-6-hydroxymethyldihydropteridine diphosphokinase [Blastocatellia bacterium]